MSKNESEILQNTENAPVVSETESVPHLIVDRFENQLTLIRDSGEQVTLKAHIIDHSEDAEVDEEDLPPMAPEEFEKAIRSVDELGLTWSFDTTPRVKAKSADTESSLLSEEFEKLQDEYPRLPYEVYLAAGYFLTQGTIYAKEAGGIDSLKRKSEVAGKFVVTPDYRSAFFFQSAIKVPYLKDIDWEVVFKLHERGVQGTPGTAYGLLALSLQDPSYGGRARTVRNVTVAVDDTLLSHLLNVLTELKARLTVAHRQADVLNKQQLLEEQNDPQS